MNCCGKILLQENLLLAGQHIFKHCPAFDSFIRTDYDHRRNGAAGSIGHLFFELIGCMIQLGIQTGPAQLSCQLYPVEQEIFTELRNQNLRQAGA